MADSTPTTVTLPKGLLKRLHSRRLYPRQPLAELIEHLLGLEDPARQGAPGLRGRADRHSAEAFA